MASRPGSEEFYRGRPIGPGFRDYTPETLQLMRNSADRSIGQSAEQGNIAAMGIRERGQMLNDSIREVPELREKNRERERAAKRFSSEEAQNKEASQFRELQSSQIKQQMDAAQKDREFMDSPTPQGKSRREMDYERAIQNDAASRRLTEAQIGAQGTQVADARKDRAIGQLSVLMEDAIASGDPVAIAQTRAQGQSMNLTSTDIALAEKTAKKTLASGRASSDVIYAGSTGGQMATEQTMKISQEADALSTLVNEAQNYKRANLGSKEAAEAQRKIGLALERMGSDPGMIDSVVSVDTGGIKTRSQKIDSLVNNAKQGLQEKIMILERSSAGASPAVQRDIQNLKSKLSAIEQIGAQQGQQYNIFSGAQGPAPKTTYMNVISGQGRPAPQNMAPPAAVSNVNGMLSGQGQGAPQTFRRGQR